MSKENRDKILIGLFLIGVMFAGMILLVSAGKELFQCH